MLRLTSWNLYNYQPSVDSRQRRCRDLIDSVRPDVLCVQEVWHATRDPDDPALNHIFAEFCEQLGMDGQLAYAPSHCHVGVLWRPDTARLTSWQEYSRWRWHHALGVAELDIGAAHPVRVATTQLHPADPTMRFVEAGYLAMAGLGDSTRITFLGGDFNAAGREPGQDGEFYDPEPYSHQCRGLPHQQFQAQWTDDPDAAPLLDRRALERARRAGLVDLAHHLGVPWQRTSGHDPGDPHGARRPDGWRGSHAALEYAHSYHVTDTAEARAVSDHLPVTLTITG